MTHALDVELALDRLEAHLAPDLDAHSAAIVAAGRTGRPRPPWPALLLDDHPAHLAVAAPATGDLHLAARARTLARWSLAARLAADRDVAAAARAPHTFAGLAARHAALHAAAPRLGHRDPSSLLLALHGASPRSISAEFKPAAAHSISAEIKLAAERVPTWAEMLADLAAHAGTGRDRIAVIDDSAVAMTVIATGGVTCLLGRADDPGRTALAAHELGHGVYAAGFAGLPLGLAAAPSRAFDEAIAAWAVARFAPERARRAAQIHARLARFEHATLGGTHTLDARDVEAAWIAAMGERAVATVATIFDEPGVAAAYAWADRVALAPAPGDLARWASEGAAFDPVAAGLVARAMA